MTQFKTKFNYSMFCRARIIVIIILYFSIFLGTLNHGTFLAFANDTEPCIDNNGQEVAGCESQDAVWVEKLVNQACKYYEAHPEDTYGHDHREEDYIKGEGTSSVMVSFEGLPSIFYDKIVYAEKGTDSSYYNLVRKDTLLRKWAPFIKIFKDDFKPVSLKRIYELSNIYIVGNNIKLRPDLPGKAKKVKERTFKGKKYTLYKIEAKEHAALNKLRAEMKAEIIFDIRKIFPEDYSSSDYKKIFDEEANGHRVRELEYKKHYDVDPGEAMAMFKQFSKYSPYVLTPLEKQQILLSLDLLDGVESVYLEMDKEDYKDHKEDLIREAHVYGVMREFIKDDYQYASLQYHFFYVNSFLPGGFLLWHQGDTEKCQIILRRKIGSDSDDDYSYYGIECSQHYYATSYRNDLSLFNDKKLGIYKNDENKFTVYISNGSHASNFTPGYHLSSNGQKGPYVAQQFYGDKGYKDEYNNVFDRLKTFFKRLGFQLLDKAPTAKDSKNDKALTLAPYSVHKNKPLSSKQAQGLMVADLTKKYILHTNYPDNSWNWGMDDVHLGGYSPLPKASGPLLPKYFEDIPDKSLFCYPIDHYYYYYRTSARMAKIPMQLSKYPCTVDLIILYGKMYRFLDEISENESSLRGLVKKVTKKQLNKAEKFVRKLKKLRGLNKVDNHKKDAMIKTECSRVEKTIKDIIDGLNQDYDKSAWEKELK